MKDGRTKLAHKAEHAVDSGLGVTVQPADRGDTASYAETLDAALRKAQKAYPVGIEEVVMDKDYHSSALLGESAEREIRSLCAGAGSGPTALERQGARATLRVRHSAAGAAERSKRLQSIRPTNPG
jgi:hypothetical protein